jgi:hypothetical protein
MTTDTSSAPPERTNNFRHVGPDEPLTRSNGDHSDLKAAAEITLIMAGLDEAARARVAAFVAAQWGPG